MLRFLFVTVCLGVVVGLPQQRISAVPRLDGRIVGGSTTGIKNFPHQISLQQHNSHICGGSLINPTTVLTAAHCTDGSPASSLSIRAGSTYHHKGGQIAQVKKIYQHPQYDSENIDYDISVLKLAKTITFGPSAKAIKLPSKGDNIKPGSKAKVSGWGATSENGGSPSLLQYVQLPVISRKDCANAYKGEAKITNREICAGHLGVGGKDSCQGDSGGPLIQNGVQIGVVSWGFGCARPEYPGVYANVEFFRTYIDKYL